MDNKGGHTEHSFGRVEVVRCLFVPGEPRRYPARTNQIVNRSNRLIACFVGCIIASLLGLVLVFVLDSPWFAFLTAAVIPTLACWRSGISSSAQLIKISAYSGTGWMLTFMLQPGFAQSAASHARRIAELPLAGNEWHLPACFVSTLLALIGVYFAPDHEAKTHIVED